MQVVDSATDWSGGYAALSNFGFGGSNVHMLLYKKPITKAQAQIVNITAEDANIESNASPSAMHIVPVVDNILADQIPLFSRNSEGLMRLACQLRVNQLKSLKRRQHVVCHSALSSKRWQHVVCHQAL